MHRIVIYPVDSAIHLLNSLRSKRFRASSSRTSGREQKKKEWLGRRRGRWKSTFFFAPALTFAQWLDWKRLLRRLPFEQPGPGRNVLSKWKKTLCLLWSFVLKAEFFQNTRWKGLDIRQTFISNPFQRVYWQNFDFRTIYCVTWFLVTLIIIYLAIKFISLSLHKTVSLLPPAILSWAVYERWCFQSVFGSALFHRFLPNREDLLGFFPATD